MTFSHVFSIAFTVITPHCPDDVTAIEILEGLRRRIQDIESHDEVLEAVGYPWDTYVIEDDE